MRLTEARARVEEQLSRGQPEDAQWARDLVDTLLVAHLQSLAGETDKETLEQAKTLGFRAAVQGAIAYQDLGGQWAPKDWCDAAIGTAAPILIATERAEVERLKGELAKAEEGLENFRAIHTQDLAEPQRQARALVDAAVAQERAKMWQMTDNLEKLVKKNPQFDQVWGAVERAVVERGDDLSMHLDNVRAKRLGKAAVLAYLHAVCPL